MIQVPTMYKVVATLVVLLGVFLGGFYTGRGQKEVQIVEKKVEVKGEDKTQIVYRDRIVVHTVTKYPDGTTVTQEKVTDQDTTKTEDKKVETIASSSSNKTISNLSNYSLGLREHLNYTALLPTSESLRHGLEFTAGRRLFGDIWLDLGVMPDSHDISLGIRVDF